MRGGETKTPELPGSQVKKTSKEVRSTVPNTATKEARERLQTVRFSRDH